MSETALVVVGGRCVSSYRLPTTQKKRRRIREGWERLSPDGAEKTDAHYKHRRSGWTVQHCGHPTANHPYAVLDPSGALHTAPNGRGFRKLAEAQAAVETITTQGDPTT